MFILTDTGSNNSGYYELQAVLTHKGRSSSSGHYVAWVKRKGGRFGQLFHSCFKYATVLFLLRKGFNFLACPFRRKSPAIVIARSSSSCKNFNKKNT